MCPHLLCSLDAALLLLHDVTAKQALLIELLQDVSAITLSKVYTTQNTAYHKT